MTNAITRAGVGKMIPVTRCIALAEFVVCAVFALPATAQHMSGKEAVNELPVVAKTITRKDSPYHPVSITPSAKTYYQSVWGVDNFLVRLTASGNLIRFSYRVVNPARAEALSDDHLTPHLIDPKRGLELVIPSLEQVGDLRQKGKPLAGKEYWMVFSNKGFPVKAGDRVNVIIGDFHADGLMVE
jgi:hypothetical protein